MKKALSDPPECTADLLAMQDTMEVLGGKWKLLILHYLMTRKGVDNTFNKMEKDIYGISAKMLSKELKSLEVNDLITREVRKTQPVTVNYAITEYGETSKEVISTLVNWGKNHRIEIIKNKD